MISQDFLTKNGTESNLLIQVTLQTIIAQIPPPHAKIKICPSFYWNLRGNASLIKKQYFPKVSLLTSLTFSDNGLQLVWLGKRGRTRNGTY